MVSVQRCAKSCTGKTAAVKTVYGECTGVYLIVYRNNS